MNRDSIIYIAGHNGLVGSTVFKKLKEAGYRNILTFPREMVDLRDLTAINTQIFHRNKVDYVFLCAARVGGIGRNNKESGMMIHDNLMIQTNMINACQKWSVKKLLFLGSSCIYPKHCPQPIKEEYLLTGELEKTNIGYAVAKISGLTMCEMYRKQYGSNFISAMPTNLYGPGDNFHLKDSHVLPALIRKFHEAKKNGVPTVMLWGSGTPMREFLYIEDLAEALIFLMKNYNESQHVNIGVGEDISIYDLALKIKDIVKYEGNIIWDDLKPDGTPKKLLDVTKINKLGWKAKTSLDAGLKKTYKWFVNNYENARK